MTDDVHSRLAAVDAVPRSQQHDEVVDPDVDLHDPAQRRETAPRQWDLLLAVSAGGVLGAVTRYGVSEAIPHAPDRFPWSTLAINATGSLLIGVLMVVVLDLTSPHRLVRPFLGVGVLGGFTTYSTFAVDVQVLVLAHQLVTALAYIGATLATCTLAVWLAVVITQNVAQLVVTRRLRHRDDPRRTR